MHTKINYSKYEYTRYLLFIAYFLSIFCITTINTSSSSNNNRKKRSSPHSGCLLYLSFFIFFIFSHFGSSFHPTICAMNEFTFSVFWVFGFPAFCFPFYTIFIFFVFHLSPEHDLFMGSSRNGTKPTEYCIRE